MITGSPSSARHMAMLVATEASTRPRTTLIHANAPQSPPTFGTPASVMLTKGKHLRAKRSAAQPTQAGMFDKQEPTGTLRFAETRHCWIAVLSFLLVPVFIDCRCETLQSTSTVPVRRMVRLRVSFGYWTPDPKTYRWEALPHAPDHGARLSRVRRSAQAR